MNFSIPKLGANVNITEEASNLQIQDGQTLGQFMTSCSQVETAICDSGLTIGLNSLMHRILDELKLCDTVKPYVFEAVISFHTSATMYLLCRGCTTLLITFSRISYFSLGSKYNSVHLLS